MVIGNNVLSISSLSGSNCGGSFKVIPKRSAGSSTVKPGPDVATSNKTPPVHESKSMATFSVKHGVGLSILFIILSLISACVSLFVAKAI